MVPCVNGCDDDVTGFVSAWIFSVDGQMWDLLEPPSIEVVLKHHKFMKCLSLLALVAWKHTILVECGNQGNVLGTLKFSQRAGWNARLNTAVGNAFFLCVTPFLEWFHHGN